MFFHKEMKNIQEKKWIVNPLQPGIKTGTSTKAEEQLFDLSEDTLLKMDFNNKKLIQFWLSAENSYPILSIEALKVLLPFSTSYQCEIGFSAMVSIKNKFQNKTSIAKFLMP